VIIAVKKSVRWVIAIVLSALQTACSQLSSPEGLVSHGLVYQRLHAGGRTELEVGPLATDSRGSLVIASGGRGDASAFAAPTYGGGKPLLQLGAMHPYALWPHSGTALYALGLDAGSAAVRIRNSTPSTDEMTLAAVVVRGTRIADFSWTEAPVARRYTSLPVKTSGPATLIAFWWGDAGEGGRKLAMPGRGYRVIDSLLAPGALVQCAVAIRRVDKAGSYDVTWTAFPRQGAQLWLVAVE
jgi:hypothetical protein